MKIIVAVDGSKFSRWATDLLVGLPLAEEPEIEIMHVVDVPTVTEALIAPSMVEKYRKGSAAMAEKKFELAQRLTAQVLERVRKRWSRVGAIITRGPVADTIVARARKEKADLIIVGARGLSNIQRFLLGSVSQKIVTYAPCAVLVVKQKIRALKRVLVAVDGSKASDKAVRFLRTRFVPKKLQGTVMYVWEYPIHPHPSSALMQVIAKKYSEPLARSGLRTNAMWVMGHSAQKIVNVASQKRPHLIVVGSRGLTGLNRFLLGGVSHQVVKHSREAVLVVR
ncbi:MAG: universal stress protein [Nitrospirota bacterium]